MIGSRRKPIKKFEINIFCLIALGILENIPERISVENPVELNDSLRNNIEGISQGSLKEISEGIPGEHSEILP